MSYNLLHIKTAEIKVTFLGHFFTVVDVVAVNRADFCNACHDARSVSISQTSFYVEAIEVIGIYFVIRIEFFYQSLSCLIS